MKREAQDVSAGGVQKDRTPLLFWKNYKKCGVEDCDVEDCDVENRPRHFICFLIKFLVKSKKKKKMKKSLKKNLIFIFLVAGLIIGTFFGAFQIGRNSVFCEVCQPQEMNFSLFWEAYEKIKQRYVNPEKIDGQKILYGAISGMLESLEDPYTVFFKPDDTKKFLEDISGSFEGVGMEIGIKDEDLQVIAPLEGTPAQEAGLMPGDKIIKVNDELTPDLTLDEVVNMIRGPKGTSVTLTIFRQGWETTKDVSIERGVIEIPSLRWELIEDNIAYIKLYQFSQKAGLDFAKIAIEILASDADKIILDIRNNPGGYLEVARDIASFFLERGDLVVIEDAGEDKIEYKAQGNSVFLNYPVVVLINKGSASGSEILAGALRDNRGIKLVGEDSFGKGSVQQLEGLSEGSSLKITTAKWLTPNGETISKVGLKPDIEIELNEEDYLAGKDPQLNKAIEILRVGE